MVTAFFGVPKADLYYFSLVLPVYSGKAKIQDPDRKPDWGAIESYTDAAGAAGTVWGGE